MHCSGRLFYFALRSPFSAYKLQKPEARFLDSEEERLFLKTAEDLYPFSPLTPLFWNKDEAGITKNPPVYAFSALLADLKRAAFYMKKCGHSYSARFHD